MIVVVGIGADGMAGLAPTSRAELARATVIYGSHRQLDLLDETVMAERRRWPSPMLSMVETLGDLDGDVHVVASGDPMLHGVGRLLIRLFGVEHVTVLPHVSCVTLACARLGWAVQDTTVVSLMTNEPQTAVLREGQAIVLCRDRNGPATVARVLTESGRGDSELTVLEQLGGHTERRRDATAGEWSANPPEDVDDLNVVAVRYRPGDSRLSVLPDDAFAHDGQITKQSMRAVTLAALAPRTGEVLWDVGAGSGSVAIEWCRSGLRCRAVAFERDEQRRKRIAENALAHGVIVDVRGAAPAAFDEAVLSDGGVDGVPRPSAVFIGGGVTQPELIEACFDRLPVGGRLSSTRSPWSPKRFSPTGIPASAVSCDGSSTTAASRSVASPAGGPRCPSRNGR